MLAIPTGDGPINVVAQLYLFWKFRMIVKEVK